MGAAAPGSKLVLITLTVRHSGDVEADRNALASGWRRFYKAVNKRWGRYPYVGVWEVTAGRDGLGHVHAHVAVVWPFRDWAEVRELWIAACPESERINFVARRRDGRASEPKGVARYLGKYLSKGAEDSEITPELRADFCAMAYQSRWVFSSKSFWVPWVPVCPGCGKPRVVAQFGWRGDPYREPPEADGPCQLEWPWPSRAGPGALGCR